MRRNGCVCQDRGGFSLLELVVVIGVLGLLASLFLPAIQRARAAAHRVECVNNLKQIGIACHEIAEREGKFPFGAFEYDKLYFALDPSLDSSALDTLAGATAIKPQWSLCPADPQARADAHGPSYLLSCGTRYYNLNQGMPSDGDGCKSHGLLGRPPREFRDSQSNTVAFSERLVLPFGPGQPLSDEFPDRVLWFTEDVAPRDNPDAYRREFRDNCLNRRTTAVRSPLLGNTRTGFDHLLTPNQIGCWNGTSELADMDWDHLVPASSLHSGGVNVLFVDGHVRFVSDSIDSDVWLALGTIAGGETTGEF